MPVILSAEHLGALATIAVFTVGLVVAARLRSRAWITRVSQLLAVVMLVDGLSLAFVGHGDWWAYLVSSGFNLAALGQSLPLQLCDVALVVATLALWLRKRVLVELTYFWGLGGSLPAIITPDLQQHFPNFPFLQYYIAHGGVVAAAILLVVGLRQWPQHGALQRVVVITSGFVAVVCIIDLATGSNYMYLRSKPLSPTLLDLMGSWPWYLVSAALFGVFLLLILDAPFRLSGYPEPGSPLPSEATRTVQIVGLVGSSVVPVVGAAAFSLWAWSFWDKQLLADRLGAIADAFAVATMCLAALAAFVAIMAYAWATQQPKLLPLIQFPGSPPNKPTLVAQSNRLIDLANLSARVAIENGSKYAGKNPAIRVKLIGMFGLTTAGQDKHWSFEATTGPVRMAQWDGGSEGAIHGSWTRELPSLNFGGVTVDSNSPAIDLEVVAEGFRHTERVQVTLKSLPDWIAENPERKAGLPQDLIRLLEVSDNPGAPA